MALNDSTTTAPSFQPKSKPVCISLAAYRGTVLRNSRNLEITLAFGQHEFSLVFELGFMVDHMRVLPDGTRE